MEWSLSKLLNYSNFNETCPWTGYTFAKVDNISMDAFSFEHSLLPSGQFRADNYFMERKGGIPFATAYLYFTVADNRLQKV